MHGAPGSVPVRLHDAEAFAHEALEPGAPDEVVGELLAGEHGEGGGTRVADHLGGVVDREGMVLRDGLQDEVHHELQAADEACLFLGVDGNGGGRDGGGRGRGFRLLQSRLLNWIRQVRRSTSGSNGG